ncbi:phosphoglucomutase/phosphomannomutase PgmG [Oceanibacterium hippocampi]|uniref:Phosphomannomutase/phosphoglucomutase n=1 Tax=Oceanibacterium hippocampi TaxID=745714 RepID=A0A1Y5SN03_9PROT|nr:phosphomannomutase/phosphoglucomutase [Oceanibacterium hippocampi]SLN41485.1 Phosphomannomutase/phosphoglucomutase [Oceanibacterium hippocampi]
MSERHDFHPTILREYDIRGIMGETLSPADARAIGRTFGTIVARKGGAKVAVGYDGRLSSPDLEAALVEGLTAAGIDVVRIGRGPTPMLYFAVYHCDADGGIMVTGSHNPPSHNGFKIMLGKASFFGADIQELGRMAAAGDWVSGAGTATEIPVMDDYVARILKDADVPREMAVVWDAGNGAAGEALVKICAKLPGRHVLLYEDIDGTFPNHHPDPTVPENLADLIRTVRGTGADFGVAFDGDGDRIGVVDGEGRVLWGDQLITLLARDVLAENPGATIIADVKASKVLFDDIAAHGGKPLMWRTGHSMIKKKMVEEKSPFAGEMSGHIFFADRYYGYDDALYVGVRFLNLAARSDRSVAALRDGLAPVVNTPEIRFDCAEDRKFKVPDEIKARLKARGADFNDIDGVRVTTTDGWWLLRASNTQAVLVARCEAGDEAGLERLKAELAAELKASGVEADL